MELGRWDEADTGPRARALRTGPPRLRVLGAARLRDHLALWRGRPLPDRTGWPPSPGHTVEDTDIDDMLAARYTYVEICRPCEPEG